MMSKNTLAYQRPQAAVLAARLAETRRFIQVVAGPRQVGKSTLVQQATETLPLPAPQAPALPLFGAGAVLHQDAGPTARCRQQHHTGTAAFAQAFKPQRSLLVGGDGIALEDFLLQPVRHWVQA